MMPRHSSGLFEQHGMAWPMLSLVLEHSALTASTTPMRKEKTAPTCECWFVPSSLGRVLPWNKDECSPSLAFKSRYFEGQGAPVDYNRSFFWYADWLQCIRSFVKSTVEFSRMLQESSEEKAAGRSSQGVVNFCRRLVVILWRWTDKVKVMLLHSSSLLACMKKAGTQRPIVCKVSMFDLMSVCL